jgi:hypothetical protein
LLRPNQVLKLLQAGEAARLEGFCGQINARKQVIKLLGTLPRIPIALKPWQ